MGCSVNISWIRCGNGIYVRLACEIPQLSGEVWTSDLSLLNEQQYIMFSWPLVVIHTVWTGGTGLNIHSITSLSNTPAAFNSLFYLRFWCATLRHSTHKTGRPSYSFVCMCVCVYSFNGRANREHFLQFPWKLQTSFNDGRHRKRVLKETVIRKKNQLFFSADCFTKEMRVCSVRVDWHFLYVFISVLVNVFNTTIAAVFKRIVLRGFLIVMKNM